MIWYLGEWWLAFLAPFIRLATFTIETDLGWLIFSSSLGPNTWSLYQEKSKKARKKTENPQIHYFSAEARNPFFFDPISFLDTIREQKRSSKTLAIEFVYTLRMMETMYGSVYLTLPRFMFKSVISIPKIEYYCHIRIDRFQKRLRSLVGDELRG